MVLAKFERFIVMQTFRKYISQYSPLKSPHEGLSTTNQNQGQSKGIAIMEFRVQALRKAVVRDIVYLHLYQSVERQFVCLLVYHLFGEIGVTKTDC